MARTVRAVRFGVSKPESYFRGDAFDNYVRKRLFPVNRYELLPESHDAAVYQNDYTVASKEPDFKFRALDSGTEFYVDAQYRFGFYDGAIEWCKAYQLKRYQEIDAKTPVYIVIGVGLPPGAPQHVFLLPMNQIKYTRLSHSFLRDYEIPITHSVSEKELLKLQRYSPALV